MLNLSPFQQGYLVDGEGQGVEGNLAYAFSLKPVEVIRYLFCFPLCKGGVFTDGKHCASARAVWGDAGGWRQNAVVETRFPPYTCTDDRSDLPGAVSAYLQSL